MLFAPNLCDLRWIERQHRRCAGRNGPGQGQQGTSATAYYDGQDQPSAGRREPTSLDFGRRVHYVSRSRRGRRRDRELTTRRVHERFVCELPVTVLFEGTELSTIAANISLGGMYLVTEGRVPFNSPVKVRFRVPSLKQDATVDGTVRWVKSDGFGVQFARLRALEVWALNQFFKKLDQADDTA